MTQLSVIDAMSDPLLFGEHFAGESWDAWRVFHKALDALPLNGAELEVFQKHTGGRKPPTEPVQECFLIVGSRGGKSRNAAMLPTPAAGRHPQLCRTATNRQIWLECWLW
ncbi:MAG: hypothetical protein JSW71_10560 [Gemmatimonadota bacterium]|nr:MAG: hypothetical protein JSW71_10560 [Gemmatimonadota bacterium]